MDVGSRLDVFIRGLTKGAKNGTGQGKEVWVDMKSIVDLSPLEMF